MRHIDGGLKSELLSLIDVAVLQVQTPPGTWGASQSLMAGYLVEMAALLNDAADPYEEAGDTEHALRAFGHYRPETELRRYNRLTRDDVSYCYDGGSDVGGARFHTMTCQLSDAQCRHAEAFGRISPYSPAYDPEPESLADTTDPRLQEASAYLAGATEGMTFGEALGIDEGPAFYAEPDDPPLDVEPADGG